MTLHPCLVNRSTWAAVVTVLLSSATAQGQPAEDSVFLKAFAKKRVYYIRQSDPVAIMFMLSERYEHHSASTSYHLQVDTLSQQSDGTYTGNGYAVNTESAQPILVTGTRQRDRLALEPVADLGEFNRKMNNAWYTEEYIALYRELNELYPLVTFYWMDAFDTWNRLSNKELDYRQFRSWTAATLRDLKDSVSRVQERYIAQTNYIVDNAATMSYEALRDSIMQIPAEARGRGWYLLTVSKEVARQNPGNYFRLAEDLPDRQRLMFFAVEDDRELVRALKEVEGHDAVKKAFAKEIRYHRTILWRVGALYAVCIGLVVWLLVK